MERFNLQTAISVHARAAAESVAAEAERQLELATNQGDDVPMVAVTVKVTVAKMGNTLSIERDAKAERKQVYKAETVGVVIDPNQPEMELGA